jgi:hypothetical protein
MFSGVSMRCSMCRGGGGWPGCAGCCGFCCWCCSCCCTGPQVVMTIAAVRVLSEQRIQQLLVDRDNFHAQDKIISKYPNLLIFLCDSTSLANPDPVETRPFSRIISGNWSGSVDKFFQRAKKVRIQKKINLKTLLTSFQFILTRIWILIRTFWNLGFTPNSPVLQHWFYLTAYVQNDPRWSK